MEATSKPCVVVAVLLTFGSTGCSGVRGTVHDGGIQKRRHQSGWHIDLRSSSSTLRTEPGTEREHLTRRTTIPVVALRDPAFTSDIYPAVPVRGPVVASPSIQASLIASPVEIRDTQEIGTTTVPSIVPEDTPSPHFNPWAIPAFALALGTITYGILGTSAPVIVIAVILTLLVAAIAVKKGRTNEWSGKGFAVAALTIGALAGLITLIALLQGGL
ncbi:MAG: hypothetical protein KDC00_09915 [Flavobacteriales bacterium]|nr:hypothetical protein [Flavobacteriales bacterium]